MVAIVTYACQKFVWILRWCNMNNKQYDINLLGNLLNHEQYSNPRICGLQCIRIFKAITVTGRVLDIYFTSSYKNISSPCWINDKYLISTKKFPSVIMTSWRFLCHWSFAGRNHQSSFMRIFDVFFVSCWTNNRFGNDLRRHCNVRSPNNNSHWCNNSVFINIFISNNMFILFLCRIRGEFVSYQWKVFVSAKG